MLTALVGVPICRADDAPHPFLTLVSSDPPINYGLSVAAGRDVNGDGYDDVLVGAPAKGLGKAYLYFGGPGVDSIPDVTFTSEPDNFGAAFGTAVELADLDADGYADVIVGNPYGGLIGRVFVFFGGPAMDATSDLVLTGTFTLEGFGFALASAGDINGDGYEDLVVGSPFYTPPYDPAALWVRGQASIFFGGPSVDDKADLILETPFPSVPQRIVGLGTDVARVGDVNGDGYADLAVGQVDTGGSDPFGFARAFIYFGGPSMDGVPDQFVRSSMFASPLDHSLSTAGDFLADGYGDLAVAEPIIRADGNEAQSNPGQVFLYFGASVAGPDSIPDLVLRGDASDGQFGYSISGGKDLNGDGHSDLLIGDPFNNFDGRRRGRVYVFNGGTTADTVPDVILNGETDGSWFGRTTSMGDLNGDGIADAIVATGQPSGLLGGRVYVYDLSVPLQARAFLLEQHQTIRLGSAAGWVRVRLEPVNRSYANADVDLSSVRLISAGTGDIEEIQAVPADFLGGRDTDRNRIAELAFRLRQSDLDQLFSNIQGRVTVEAAMEGRTLRGRQFRAPLELTVVGARKGGKPICSVHPNPANPQATLSFEITMPGRVTVRLFDINGRIVRNVAIGEYYEAGTHSISVDGRGDRGGVLASGVYFYRFEGPDGDASGRLIIAR
jgi:hypothetical protein